MSERVYELHPKPTARNEFGPRFKRDMIVLLLLQIGGLAASVLQGQYWILIGTAALLVLYLVSRGLPHARMPVVRILRLTKDQVILEYDDGRIRPLMFTDIDRVEIHDRAGEIEMLRIRHRADPAPLEQPGVTEIPGGPRLSGILRTVGYQLQAGVNIGGGVSIGAVSPTGAAEEARQEPEGLYPVNDGLVPGLSWPYDALAFFAFTCLAVAGLVTLSVSGVLARAFLLLVLPLVASGAYLWMFLMRDRVAAVRVKEDKLILRYYNPPFLRVIPKDRITAVHLQLLKHFRAVLSLDTAGERLKILGTNIRSLSELERLLNRPAALELEPEAAQKKEKATPKEHGEEEQRWRSI